MKRASAILANQELQEALEQLFQIPDMVSVEAHEEHLGYVAMTVPILDALFSMLSTIWRAFPELKLPERESSAALPSDEPSTDDSYRWADSMKRETAEKVAVAVREVSSHLGRAMKALQAGMEAHELKSVLAQKEAADAGLQVMLERVASQHPGIGGSAAS